MKPTRYRVEALDKFLSFQSQNNDHQIRGILSFDGQLDLATLQKAVRSSIEEIPLIGCRYRERSLTAYWEQIDSPVHATDIVTFVAVEDVECEIEKFLSTQIDYQRGPQLVAEVIRCGEVDTLCLIVNHMIFDGTAFKQYLNRLGQLYTQLANGTFTPGTHLKQIDRSLERVFRRFKPRELWDFAFQGSAAGNRDGGLHFPRDASGFSHGVFLRAPIADRKFQELKRFAREHHLTINDVVLAAYYRALYQIIDPGGATLRIPCMVDLRRYLPNGEAAGFANMASMIETQCGNFGDFLLTAKEVGRQMAEKKSRAPGLAGLPLLSLLNRVLPHALFAKLVKGVVKYPEISISNLGLLPPDLNFNNIPLREACVLTALKYAPSFQLSFSTHKDTLTLGVALLGTELDRKRAKDFLGILLNELPVG